MGTFRIGSGGASPASPQTATSENEIQVEIPTVKEVFVERQVEIPVVKEVAVEVLKPVFKFVDIEEKVQKPKIVVEEVPQVIIKPVFTIKQETVILDQLQKKLDESVKLAQEKVEKINQIEAKRLELDHRTLETLQVETKALKLALYISIALSAIAVVASFLR